MPVAVVILEAGGHKAPLSGSGSISRVVPIVVCTPMVAGADPLDGGFIGTLEVVSIDALVRVGAAAIAKWSVPLPRAAVMGACGGLW